MPQRNFVTPPDPRGAESGGGTRLIAVAQGFVGGLDTEESSRHITPDATPDMANFRFLGTEVRKSYGWNRFGEGTTLTLNPLRLISFADGTGVEHLVMLNNDEARRYNSSGDTWDSLGTGLFTIDDTYRFDWTLIATDQAPGALTASRNLIVVTNGLDVPYAWDGDTGVTTFTATTAAPVCKYITTFGNRLVCAYITDGGQDYAQRVQWSVNGNIEDFTGIGAGAADLTTAGGIITGMRALRGNLLIYKEDGIEAGFLTGQASAPFAFVPSPGIGVGLRASWTLTQVPFAAGAHVFLASDYNVYLFDGSSLTAIGNPIRRAIANDLSEEYLYTAFGFVHEQDTEYWLHIPVSGSVAPNVAYVWNWTDNTWSRRDYERPVYAGTNTSFSQTLTYDGLTGQTYEELAVYGTYDDMRGGTTPEQIILGLDDPGTVRARDGVYGEERTVIANAIPFYQPIQDDLIPVVDVGTSWTGNDNVKTVGGGVASTAVNGQYTTSTPLDEVLLPRFEIPSSALPSDAVLVGIEVRVLGYGAAAEAGRELTVGLYKFFDSRTPFTGIGYTVKDAFLPGPNATDIDWVTYGGSSDLWGGAGSIVLSEFLDNNKVTVGMAKTIGSATGSCFVDTVQLKLWYTSETQTGTKAITSYISTRDHDFGFPNRAKTLERVVIRYRDVTTSPVTLQVFVSTDKGQTYTMGSDVTTEGTGDGSFKEVTSDFFTTGNSIRVRLLHSSTSEDVRIVEVELQALLRGGSWGG